MKGGIWFLEESLSGNINLLFHLLVRFFNITLHNIAMSPLALAYLRMNKDVRKHLCLSIPSTFFSLQLSECCLCLSPSFWEIILDLV